MVNSNIAYKFQEIEKEIDYTFLPEQVKYTSVSLMEVFSNKLRLEANSFNLIAKVAKEKVINSNYGYVNLWSKDGLITHASYPGRFKRIYVSKNEGEPFFLPSQMTEIKPKPTKYISPKTYRTLKGVEISPNNLLMSRSGTIGKCTISSRSNIGKIYSDDIIRISFKNEHDLGYTYAFFQTNDGQLILQTNNYGAVVKHIEPEHLESIVVPNAPDYLKKEIHQLINLSYSLRDDSNDLLDQAEKILYSELNLKPIEILKKDNFVNPNNLRSYTTKLSKLRLRLDSSYHLPIFDKIEKHIEDFCSEIKYLRDKEITNAIILPGRFKRTYVEQGEHGIKFIGGRQINDLNPPSEKFLSKSIHGGRLGKELILHENCILITRSGTIGKVALVPKHWEDWAANEHIIRVFPNNNNIAGYIFCWLNSEYGHEMIRKHTYGAVVDEIDATHVGDIPIPLLTCQEKQKEINDLVLKANELRHLAHLKEQDAIEKMQDIIENRIEVLKLDKG